MSPLPRRMLGRAASWENPQVHPSPLPERLTHVGVAVAIRLFVGFPHQILNSLSRLECHDSDIEIMVKTGIQSEPIRIKV